MYGAVGYCKNLLWQKIVPSFIIQWVVSNNPLTAGDILIIGLGDLTGEGLSEYACKVNN